MPGAYTQSLATAGGLVTGLWPLRCLGGIGTDRGTGADQGAVRAAQISKPRHVTKNKPNLVGKVSKCSAYKGDHS